MCIANATKKTGTDICECNDTYFLNTTVPDPTCDKCSDNCEKCETTEKCTTCKGPN